MNAPYSDKAREYFRLKKSSNAANVRLSSSEDLHEEWLDKTGIREFITPIDSDRFKTINVSRSIESNSDNVHDKVRALMAKLT